MTNLVDLTHPLDRHTVLWPGDPAYRRSLHARLDRDGYELGRVSLGEHTGTHIGVASHMRAGGAALDALPAARLVLPCAVVDVRGDVDRDADHCAPLGVFRRWERRHGTLPRDGAVLLLTGWSTRWGDEARYLNRDAAGVMHTPGFSLEAARWLASSRGVVALGIDAPGIDPGADPSFDVNRFWLDGDRYHIENLTNLDRLPPTGATLFVGALPIANGTGAPARVIAGT